MPKPTQKTQLHHRSHQSRATSLGLAAVTLFSMTGLGHAAQIEAHDKREHMAIMPLSRALDSNLEKENETARHAVRLDVGIRLPSVSGT